MTENGKALFGFHKMNARGQEMAKRVAVAFDNLLIEIARAGDIDGEQGRVDPRLMALTKTKLEEACFFAKKSYAVVPDYQEKES